MIIRSYKDSGSIPDNSIMTTTNKISDLQLLIENLDKGKYNRTKRGTIVNRGMVYRLLEEIFSSEGEGLSLREGWDLIEALDSLTRQTYRDFSALEFERKNELGLIPWGINERSTSK